MSETSKMVTCPLNHHHKVLPNRLALHLTRCAREHPSLFIVPCPYYITHLHPVEEISEHILNCPYRPLLAETKSPAVTTGQHEEVKADDDWEADPPVETYNPLEKCKEKFVILNPQGLTPSDRRAARQRELQRWIDNDKLPVPPESDKTQE